ncbi:hypothetical protein GCM10025882_11370 [Acinetobacter gyllenbergii]|nr:hypothetical protein GCM10025882_11370 [Acinetobacter gyllenbergii]
MTNIPETKKRIKVISKGSKFDFETPNLVMTGKAAHIKAAKLP